MRHVSRILPRKLHYYTISIDTVRCLKVLFKMYQIKLLILFTIGCSLVKCQNFTSCKPFGWKSDDEGQSFLGSDACFVIKPYSQYTYDVAQAYCSKNNAHLVSLHSNEDNENLVKLISHQLKKVRTITRGVWIGLKRNSDTGSKDSWSDGSALDYSNWAQSQDEPLEHCTYLKGDQSEWYHSNCGQLRAFVCKGSINESVITPPPSEVPLTGNCAEGWTRFKDQCYKTVDNPKAFEDASTHCRSNQNSDLVSIHSNDEQDYVVALLGTMNFSLFWTGGYKSNEGGFIWKSNKPFNYSQWGPKWEAWSPEEKKCIRISMLKGGKWEDVKCDLKLPFLCQRPISSQNNVASSTAFPAQCPSKPDYVQYRNACFKIYGGLSTWPSAESVCKDDGGHLASIADVQEHSLIKHLTRNGSYGDLWIGMKVLKHEHESFEWLDSSPVYFTPWGTFTPSPANVTQCVYQQRNGDWKAAEDCEWTKAFICKIYSTVSPVEKEKRPKKCPTVKMDNGTVVHRWVDLDSEVDYCYYVDRSAATSGEAHSKCFMRGGNLVSIHSDHEAKLLSNFGKQAINTVRSYTRPLFWLGLRRKINGGFQWYDGSPVDYLDWADQEPSNETVNGCVASDLTFTKWETKNCDYGGYYFFICSVQKIDIEVTTSGESKIRHGFWWFSSMVLLALIFLSAIGVVGFYIHKCYQDSRIKETTSIVNVAYTADDLNAPSTSGYSRPFP